MDADQTRQALLERAGKWVRAKAAESEDEIAKVLEERKTELLGMMEGLSRAQARFKPAPDKWSIAEVALHLTNAHRLCRAMIFDLAEGRVPQGEIKIGVLDPDPGDEAKIFADFRASFDGLAETVDRLRRPADLSATRDHPFFGPFNCREWTAFCPLHIGAHVNQVKRIKGSEGYPA